jgi:hypothetical protein
LVRSRTARISERKASGRLWFSRGSRGSRGAVDPRKGALQVADVSLVVFGVSAAEQINDDVVGVVASR